LVKKIVVKLLLVILMNR